MTGLAEQPLARFLEDVADARPAPGGGSSAAVTAALAAGLVEMAAGLAAADASDLVDSARSLRHEALGLAERELASYAPVLEALRRPRDDPGRPEAVAAALEEASRAPLAIAEAAARTAELGLAAARAARPSVRGDALVGAVLAEAAAAAAAALVEINLERRPGHALLDRARAARERAAAARAGAAGAAGP